MPKFVIYALSFLAVSGLTGIPASAQYTDTTTSSQNVDKTTTSEKERQKDAAEAPNKADNATNKDVDSEDKATAASQVLHRPNNSKLKKSLHCRPNDKNCVPPREMPD